MSISGRIDNLFNGLTARERAVLVIRAVKSGRKVDPELRRRIPPAQENEFDELLSNADALRTIVSNLIVIWKTRMEVHVLRQALLAFLELQDNDMVGLASYIVPQVGEQVTDARRLMEEPARMRPGDELAVGNDSDALAEAALEGGTIDGRLANQAIDPNLSSSLDRRGEPVPVKVARGEALEMVAGDQKEVRRDMEARERAGLINAIRNASQMVEKDSPQGDLYSALEQALIRGVTTDSHELRAADQLLADLQGRLGGEDPLDLALRELLDNCRSELMTMCDQLGLDANTIDDCPAELAMMRKFIRRHR
jgi:hypothetical protein